MIPKSKFTASLLLSQNEPIHQLYCRGDWTLTGINKKALNFDFNKITSQQKIFPLILNASTITAMDSSGAWQLFQWINNLSLSGKNIELHGLSDEHNVLYQAIKKTASQLTKLPLRKEYKGLALLGKKTLNWLSEILAFLNFIGKTFIIGLQLFLKPSKIRMSAIANVIENTGLSALGIVALLSFMIGIVLTYQMGFQLKNYGATSFIINLLGLAILREFAPLLTAIMVAGRSGSSFTAQLGMMKVNEEIDALTTMGVLPTQLLILPRIFGLTIALPLLTIWADIFGILGGMAMTHSMLHIGYIEFLRRFPKAVDLSSLLIGVGKAPIFALIISSVACFQGLRVKASADSVGKKTTRSVVQAIFFIILADALFSVLFSTLNI